MLIMCYFILLYAYKDFLESIWIIAFLSWHRSGENAPTAYVTYRDAYALETALLLNVSCLFSYFLALLLDIMDWRKI